MNGKDGMARMTRVWVPLLAFVCMAGCSAEQESADSAAPLADNAELEELYEQDQSDRSAGPDIDWDAVTVRDSLRRVRVHEMLAANDVQTSEDFRHAAMIFQHGSDTTAARTAHELALTAVELDSTNTSAKWLVAAAWDRYLMRKGEPQWYGTQFRSDGPGTPWRLYDIDTTAVTDEERQELNVPTLAEARARVEEMNRREER